MALPTPRAGEIANNDNKIKFSVPGGLKPGFYAVSATYQGASAYENSTAVGNILVKQVPTIIEMFSSKNPAMNGDSVALRAGVLPNPPGTVKITPQLGAPSGTLTFAVTDMNGDMLTCDGGSNVITISNNANNQGFGRCVIDAGQLMSADSPYTVTVSYSGDSKYLSSNGELKVHITS